VRPEAGDPSGTIVDRTYDAVDRLSVVKERAATIAGYTHMGLGCRRLQREYPTLDRSGF
jgi:hypothetical protein